MELFDSSGARVAIEKELYRGGEGTIHPVAGRHDLFAKLYHRPIDPAKQAKLEAMTRTAQAPLLRVAAWPTSTLHTPGGGRMVGFVMPRFDGKRSELHELYTPATRKQTFRHADWAFLFQAARNVAAAVHTVHTAGHVVGDVNQRNFIVGGDATVKVLDCDSFQIRGSGRIFHCEVGVPEFTPPELQNRVLAGVERTPHHDAFGLAVLCFQLLFMGRHPFAGRFLGQGEMPIERAIAEGRFAFGRHSRSRMMEPPPNMVSFDSLPPRLAALFEAAFSGTAARPTAQQWSAVLDAAKAELRTCTAERMHQYYNALSRCPWCGLESAAGVYFFIGVVPARTVTLDLAQWWAEIMAGTTLPYEPPVRPTIHVTGAPVVGGLRARRAAAVAAKTIGIATFCMALLEAPQMFVLMVGAIIVVTLLPTPGGAERRRRQAALREAERLWAEAYKAAERELSVDPLLRLRLEMQRLRKTYESVEAEKQAELAKMMANAREIQLQHHLEHNLIRNHSIPGIGPQRKATLAAWGIDSAADVSYQSLAVVQGFGPALQSRLMAWRALVEARFVFDPKRAIPQQDITAVEYRWARRKSDLEQQLRAGAENARRLNRSIRERRESIATGLTEPARQWAQARADVDVINRALSLRGTS